MKGDLAKFRWKREMKPLTTPRYAHGAVRGAKALEFVLFAGLRLHREHGLPFNAAKVLIASKKEWKI